MPSHFNDQGIDLANWTGESFSTYTGTNMLMEDLSPEDIGGALLAWNPRTQTAAWKVDHDAVWNGGTLAAAGNRAFQGTADGRLHAWRAEDGSEMWSFFAGLGISAAPISFSAGGRQYIALLVGRVGAVPT